MVSWVALLLGFCTAERFIGPACFSESEQSEILGTLHQKKSVRTNIQPIKIFEFKHHYGGLFTLHLARILLEELMGYTVDVQIWDEWKDELDEYEVFNRLVSRQSDVMLEVSVDVDTSKVYKETVDVDKFPTVADGSQLGVTQQEGLYTSLGLAYAQGGLFPAPDFWRSYNSTELLDALNQSLRVELDVPRFVPPQCQGSNDGFCVEMLANNNISGASLESMIRVNYWNMTVAYVGNNLTDIVHERISMNQPVLFFYFEPSEFITSLGTSVTRVTLPMFTSECLQQRCEAGVAPLDCLQRPSFGKQVYCDYRPYPARKLYSVAWQNETDHFRDVVSLIHQLSVWMSDQEAMLADLNSSFTHSAEPSQQAFAQIACHWLHATKNHDKYHSASTTGDPRWFGFVFNTQRTTHNLLPDEAVIAMALVVGLLIIGSFSLQMALVRFHSSPIIKASSYRLCHCMIVGSYLVYASVLIGGLWPQSQSDSRACIVAPTLFGVGYTLMLGAVALKNWRIHRIFNLSRVGTKAPSDAILFSWLMSLVAAEVIFDVFWFFFAETPLLQTISVKDASRPLEDTVLCNFGSKILIFFVPKIMLLAWSCFIGFRVRNVRHNFNESQKMAFASYAVFMEFIFAIALTFIDLDPTVGYILSGSLICFGSVNALIILFFPKFWSIWQIHQRKHLTLTQSLLNSKIQPVSMHQATSSLEHPAKDLDYDLVGELMSVRTQLQCALQEIHRLKRGSVVAPLVPDDLSEFSFTSSGVSDETFADDSVLEQSRAPP